MWHMPRGVGWGGGDVKCTGLLLPRTPFPLSPGSACETLFRVSSSNDGAERHLQSDRYCNHDQFFAASGGALGFELDGARAGASPGGMTSSVQALSEHDCKSGGVSLLCCGLWSRLGQCVAAVTGTVCRLPAGAEAFLGCAPYPPHTVPSFCSRSSFYFRLNLLDPLLLLFQARTGMWVYVCGCGWGR